MGCRYRVSIQIIVSGLLILTGSSLVVSGLISASTTISLSGRILYQSVPWLHTSGTELYDSNNNPARLYLVVIHDGQGFRVSQSDIQHIADMGFKGVRFFIYWGQCQPDGPNSIYEPYFTTGGTGSDPHREPGLNAIDNIVNWCRDVGLYVLLCPGWSSTWDVPSWASSSTGLTTAGGGSTTDMLNNPTIQSGINYLYGWMAARYVSYSNVMFESFNELQSSSRPCSASERQLFANFNNMWVSAIEANEGSTSHIKVIQLLYDWSQWNYVLGTSTPATISGTHSNVIFATHSYPLVSSSSTVADQCASIWATFVHNQNYPWMDTEYSHTLGGGFAGLQQGTDLLIKYNAVGWGYFDYEYSGNSANTANVNNPTNAASILPILQPYME